MRSLAAALADPDPSAALAAFADLVHRTAPARLFTMMSLDPATGISRRVWTNAPQVYPVGGEKPLPDNRWTDIVIRQRRTWVANSLPEVAELLFDHETIASLGCGSALNLPVVVGGDVLGTVNLLDAEGWFTADRLAAVETLRLPACAVLMRVARG